MDRHGAPRPSAPRGAPLGACLRAIRGAFPGALLFVLLALGLSSPLRAQGRDCELLPGAREASRVITGGQEYLHISGPARFVCGADVILQADSAVGLPNHGEFELIGHVFYQDSAKTLTAEWARYLREEARLLARGKVVLTDRKSDSRITGPELEYLPANEHRAEAEAIFQGRPHAIFKQRPAAAPITGDSAAQHGAPGVQAVDSATLPLEVDADLMRVYGESRFLALGSVELVRGETRGSAREGEFDHLGNTMVLTGSARLEGEGYVLNGDRIEAALEGDNLREVTARRDAELKSEDLDLQAPELHIFLGDGKVERLVAVGTAPGDTAAPGSTRPVVTSRDLMLSADSIEALAPGQQLERLIAIGAAYAVRAADSLDAGLPEAIANDWLVGDTITGYFAAAPVEAATVEAPTVEAPTVEAPKAKAAVEVPADSVPAEPEAKPRAILERLIAVGEGGGARSLYRIREKGHEQEPPSANYLVANRIVLVLHEGEVTEVEADGPIEGMHLQPTGGRARDPGAAGTGAGGRPPQGTAGGQ